MKKIAILLSGGVIFLAACGDNSSSNPDKSSGDEQIQAPVMNSGTESERQRATDAVRDSTIGDSATKITGDSGAHTLPH